MKILQKLLGAEESVRDPVCGMTIPAGRVRDSAAYAGRTYHFCSHVCKQQFEREPEKFVVKE